jgi:3'-phosphoadenosine 5'-phosphosulfate sulfotransferase (PAPS reductase)/FAD synthetase
MSDRPSVDLSRLGDHDKIVLQFSGGKDSLALLYLFKGHLHRMTVLHCDTADQLPEMQDLVAVVESNVPNFHRVRTDAPAWIAQHGLPSDLVPIRCHPGVANVYREAGHPIVPVTDCCAANRWRPMQKAIRELGPSLVIHGQRRSDEMGWDKTMQGDTTQGAGDWQVWAPISEWSDDDVMTYLRGVGAPILPWYSHKPHAPECATCPASWSEGRGAYLKKHHPVLAARYGQSLAVLLAEISPECADLLAEWRDVTGQNDL